MLDSAGSMLALLLSLQGQRPPEERNVIFLRTPGNVRGEDEIINPSSHLRRAHAMETHFLSSMAPAMSREIPSQDQMAEEEANYARGNARFPPPPPPVRYTTEEGNSNANAPRQIQNFPTGSLFVLLGEPSGANRERQENVPDREAVRSAEQAHSFSAPETPMSRPLTFSFSFSPQPRPPRDGLANDSNVAPAHSGNGSTAPTDENSENFEDGLFALGSQFYPGVDGFENGEEGNEYLLHFQNFFLPSLIRILIERRAWGACSTTPMRALDRWALEKQLLSSSLVENLVKFGSVQCSVCQEQFSDILEECADYDASPSVVASVSTDSDSTDEEEVESLVEEETVNRVGLNSSCDRVAPFSAPPVYHRRHDESVCRLPCNHFFCFSCMLKWATYSSTCPNCRCVLENLVEKYKNNDPPQPLWWEGCSELKQEEEENALQGGIEKIQQAEKSSSWEANEEIRPLFSVSSTETPEPLEAAPASADANPEIRTEEVLGNEGSRTSWVPLENETDSSILHPLVQPTPPALPNTTPYSHPFFMSTGTTTYSNATVLSSETDFSPSTSPAFPSYPPQDSRKANTFPSTMEPNSSLALVHSTSIEGTSGPREGGLPSLVRDTHESHLLFCSPNESHSPVMAEASEEKKMPQLLAPTTVLSSSGGFAGRRSMIDSDAEQLTGLKVLNEPEVLLAETGKESAVREVDHELSLSQPVASTLSSNQFASDFSTDMDVEAYGSGVKTVKRIRNSRRETPHAQLLSGSGSLHSSHVSLPQESVSGVAPNSSDLGSSLLSYRRARVPFLTNREVIAGHPPSDLSIFPRIRLGSERPGPNRLRVVYPVSPSTSSSQDVLEKRGQ